jgi:hypothetical protein
MRATWFEARAVAALLTMRVYDLILMSHANGSRQCAPDDRLRMASRRMKATGPVNALMADFVADLAGDDVAEQLPAFAVEPHELHLLDREVIVR